MTNKNSRLSLLVGLTVLAVVVLACITRAQIVANPGNKEVAWPDTRAGRWAKAYVEAYNTPGKDSLQRFVKEHFSDSYLRENHLERVVSDHFQTRGMLNKLEVQSVTAEGDFIVRVIVPAKPYGWAEFRIELSPKPPYDITNLRIGPVLEPAVKARAVKNYTEWQDLRDLVEQVRHDAGAPAMVAAIVRGGQIVEKAASGVRRFDRSDRVQIGDRFHLGSVAKSFTATMIGKLVEDGVLRWDMTIDQALGDIPMRSEYRSVTLEQLLQHRGGVPAMVSSGEFAEGFKPWRPPAKARAALVRQVLTEKPFKPGEYSYSNAGYVVAGYMAERVTRRSWEELMRSLVFKPLELRSAGFRWPTTEDRLNQPLGHVGTPPNFNVQDCGEDLSGEDYYGPASSVHCSIEDLARYAAFHLQGLRGIDGVLKAETIRRLHTPVPGEHYMGGWVVNKEDEGERRDGHEGTAGTFFAMVQLYPNEDLAVVAAANIGPPAATYLRKMRDAIHRRMKDKSYASGAHNGVEWPDTIAARRARAFVEAMNAGDEKSMRCFMTENYSSASLEEKSIEDRMKIPLGIRAQMGKLTVSSVTPIDELSVAFVCKSEAVGIWLKFTVKVKKEPPHYWAGVTVLPAAAP
ncbi:serine hydrolase domain-containing protein [Planctomycetota bacterium]